MFPVLGERHREHSMAMSAQTRRSKHYLLSKVHFGVASNGVFEKLVDQLGALLVGRLELDWLGSESN